MNNQIIERVGIAGLIAILSYVYNSLGTLFWIYVLITCIDFATGFGAAWVTGELSSKIGKKGIVGKVFTFLIIVVAILLDYVATTFGFGTHGAIYIATCGWYIAEDLVSIFENVGRAGCRIPSFLRKAVKILRELSEKKSELYDTKTKSNKEK